MIKVIVVNADFPILRMRMVYEEAAFPHEIAIIVTSPSVEMSLSLDCPSE